MKQQQLPTPQEAFEQQRAHALAQTIFPTEEISEYFKECVHIALRNCSWGKLGCHEETYKNLVTFSRPFFMPEVALMLDIVKFATPQEMDVELGELLDIIEKTYKPLKAKWDAMDDEISKPIMSKINVQAKITNNVPIGKQLFKGATA